MNIVWTQEMSVFDKKIDEQHKKLLGRVNTLKETLDSRPDVDSLLDLINFFGKYAEDHLKYEERYMEDHKYPQYDEHKKIHDYFRAYFEKLLLKLNEPQNIDDETTIKMIADAQDFLEDWWVNHILKEDHKYADYIRAQD